MLGFVVLVATAATAAAVASLDKLVLGVDYYPEQWPIMDMVEDMRSIKEDLGANTIRVGEFMWSSLEPSDGTFNFTLDR
jgi:beta-galactosidase GanA